MSGGRPSPGLPTVVATERVAALPDEGAIGRRRRERARPTQMEPLADADAERSEPRHQLCGLDPLGRDAEAEPLYRQSLDLLTAGYPRDVERWRLRTVLRNYADLLRRTARAEEARALERRLEQVR